MKKQLLLVFLGFILCGFMVRSAPAEEKPWNRFSARLQLGQLNNGGSIDSHDGYEQLDMGQELEYGADLILDLSHTFEAGIGLSTWKTSGTQYNDDNDNKINVHLDAMKISIDGRRKYYSPGMFVPWWGGGADIALVELKEQETIAAEGGYIRKDSKNTTHTLLGVHGAAGLDVYPARYSALALFIEARFSLYWPNNDFDGDINGFAFMGGIRWDFWQR
jgi:hypothetical protein